MESSIKHCDCLDGLKELADNSIDLVLTDPPYGMGYDIDYHKKKKNIKYGKAAALKKEYGFSNWDKMPDTKVFNEIFRVSKNQIIFGGEHLAWMFKKSRGWIVWDKQTGSNNFSDCELAYTSFDRPIKKYTYIWNGMIQQNMKNKEIRYHPTQKPVQLFSMLLEGYSKEGDIVCDPFCGSGTTALACLEMKRRYICFEKEQKYYDISLQRIKEYKDQLKLF